MRRTAKTLLTVAVLLATCYGEGCTHQPRASAQTTSLSTGTFEVTSYNIHGMASTLTGDNTPERMREIAKLLRSFSGIFCLQEHFLSGENSPTEDVLGHGFKHIERFTKRLGWKPYSSGLTVLSAFRVAATKMHHYTVCNGSLSAGNDCLAAKGFLVTRTELIPGTEVDVYTTHMDSGSGSEDAKARKQQLAELLASIHGFSEGRAMIIVGDFNIRWDRESDRLMFNTFLADSGLRVAPTGMSVCPEHFKLDGILYRSGTTVQLQVLGTKDHSKRFSGLSDHHPVSVTFGWTSAQ